MLKLASTRFILKKCLNLNISIYKCYSNSADIPIILADDSGYKAVPHYTEKSSLFIKANSVFPHLISPDLDLKCTFESQNSLAKSALTINLEARHMNLDLDKLNEDYSIMSKLELEIDDLTQKKDKISAKVNMLVKTSQKPKKELAETNEFKELIAAANEIKAQINRIEIRLKPLQELVKTVCLRLPNSLHASSLLQNQLIFSFNDIEYKKCRADWKKVLQSEHSWSFIENSSNNTDTLPMKYLVGEYARLEQALINYVHEKIENLNSQSELGPLFEHFRSSSMFRSAVVEGCGQKFNDPREILNMVEFSNDGVDLLHLTGSASLSGLILNFIRSKIKPKYLPWHIFTNGRNYSPQKGQINRFDFMCLSEDKSEFLIANNSNLDCLPDMRLKGQQYIDLIRNELETNSSKLFVQNAEVKIDSIFIDYLKMFVYVYKDFGLPTRFRLLSGNELDPNDSLRIIVEIFSPGEHTFLKVGEVSLLNDYVSERLQIRIADQNKNKQLRHVHMIYTILMDVNSFMQILIESNLTLDSKFLLPNVLQKFY